MFSDPRTAGRRSSPSPLAASEPTLAPLFTTLGDALRVRAQANRLRDQFWEQIRLLTEAHVRPVDYEVRLHSLNLQLFSAQNAITSADTWLAAQPAAA